MKKINMLLSAVLLFGMAACDDKSDLGVMQVNPQQTIMEAEGVAVAFGTGFSGATLNLNDMAGKNVNVLDITKAEIPEDCTLKGLMQLSTTEDFDQYLSTSVSFEEGKGYVEAERIASYLESVRANNPVHDDVYVRFLITAETGTSSAIVGNGYMGEKKINIISYVPVEEKYYLVGEYLGDNKVNQAIEMSHTNRDVYSDPVFTIIVDVTPEQAAAGYTWKVVPQSAYEANDAALCFGVANAEEASGKLVLGGAPAVIKEQGPHKIEINMEYRSYNVTFAFPYMYTPGGSNGWGFDHDMLLFTSDYVEYHGYCYLKGEFKLTGEAGWGLNWGLDADGYLKADGPNIPVPEEGLYYLKANMSEMTFGMTPITRIGVIGDFNGWGSDVALTPNAQFNVWSGEVTLNGGGWKFRMNDGWALNLGGTMDDLVADGSNLPGPGEGTYIVTLDLSKLPYSCTVEPKR